MEKKYHIARATLVFALLICCNTLFSQKDTLHIYYQGLQTNIADSNDLKITNWFKAIKAKGGHYDVEIYAYYESSTYKKFMVERAENLHLVVNRKARDLITVKFFGPLKGQKWQRCMADVVYVPTGTAIQEPAKAPKKEKEVPAAEPKKETEAVVETSAPAEKKEEASPKPQSETTPVAAKEEKPKKEKPKKEEKVKEEKVKNKSYEYVMDSVYVNGQLKVTKRKVKKQEAN